MTRSLLKVLGVVAGVAMALGVSGTVAAQQTAMLTPRSVVPVKVDVVLSRYQGDKKTSSLPFTLWLNVNPPSGGTSRVSLRMGVDVPIGSSTVTSGDQNNATQSRTTSTSTTTSHVDFRYVGTSIDCSVSSMEDGRFSVNLSVQDSAVFTADGDGKPPLKIADPMAFRTFSFSNTLPMRDGQTLPWATATDKITGEVLRLEATLTVLK
jgi:hypothetical protein